MLQSFDDVLFELGNPGKYRILLFLMLVGNMFPVGMNSMFTIFTIFTPPHRCTSLSTPTYGSVIKNITQNDVKSENLLDSCELWKDPDNYSAGTTECIHGIEYDLDEGEWFVSTQFELVCSRKYMKTVGLSCQYAGVVLGGIIYGFVSDHYGRRFSMIVSTVLQTIFSIALAFTNSASAYFACAFFLGICYQGMHSTSYTASSELFHPNQRTYQGVLISTPWSISLIFISFLFWLLRRWNHVQMVIAFLSLISVVYSWFIPESLRWLMTKGRVDDAYKVYVKFCLFNKIKIHPDAKEDLQRLSVKMIERQSKAEKASFSVILKSSTLRMYSFILGGLYFTSSLMYLGISFVIPYLGGNKYMCYMMSGFFELLARLISISIFQRYGRRIPLTCLTVITSLCCAFTIVIRFYSLGGPDVSEKMSITFALIGLFLLTACFSGLSLYLTEMYPTLLRAVGLSFCVTCGRIGSMLVPAIMLLETIWIPMPIILSSTLGIISGLCILLLPETNKKPLPDSVAEVKTLTKH